MVPSEKRRPEITGSGPVVEQRRDRDPKRHSAAACARIERRPPSSRNTGRAFRPDRHARARKRRPVLAHREGERLLAIGKRRRGQAAEERAEDEWDLVPIYSRLQPHLRRDCSDSEVYSHLHVGRTRASPTTEAASTHAWSARGRPPTGASTGTGTRARHGARPARVPSRGQPMLCARVHAWRERTWRRRQAYQTGLRVALRCTAFHFELNVASNVALTRSRHSRETTV